MSNAMLTVEHVDKSFPVAQGALGTLIASLLGRVPRRQVLFDVSLDVRAGELFGLLGPNGAGKSTLLRLLATLTEPDRGRMTIDGIDVQHDPIAAKRRIGLCTSEERSFYFRLTARQNLEFFGALVGLAGQALRRRINECVDLLDLAASIDARFGGFSSGMRVRLAMARALLADPAILFLDEPTRAVDPVHAEEMRLLIRNNLIRGAGKTVILATNLLNEAWELCDRVAVINRGRIVALGPPNELGLELRTLARYRVSLNEAGEELLARTRSVPGFREVQVERTEHGVELQVELEQVDESLGALLRALSLDGAVLRDFRPVDVEPVDVFKRVIVDRD